MSDTKMRSRQYINLTNYEIEKYLERNDIIIIPVGNCETHAGMPVDAEFVAVEGWARLIAEKVDGLVLPDVIYFNPGGTQIGRGTIHMSMSDSFNYTKALAHSLLNQGFRRQIWIPSHMPTSDFLHAMVEEFFDETKVPMLFLDVNAYLRNMGLTGKGANIFDFRKAHTKAGDEVDPFNDTMLGSYKLCGRLGDVPAKGEVDFPDADPNAPLFPNWFPEYEILSKCNANYAAPAPFYYSHPDDHIGPPTVKFTREEMERRADIGLTYMKEMVDDAEFDRVMLALRHLQEFMANTVVKQHYDHLPKNRYSSVNPF